MAEKWPKQKDLLPPFTFFVAAFMVRSVVMLLSADKKNSQPFHVSRLNRVKMTRTRPLETAFIHWRMRWLAR